MNISTADRKSTLHNQANQELESLVSRGLRAVGNGFSPVLLVKGDLNAAEIAGGELLAGADGNALRSALSAVGFAPEDFCGMAAVYGEGADASAGALGSPLSVEFFREAVEAFDPEVVILLDDAATALMREAYADALAAIEDFNTAMLMPGLVAPVLGRRVLALDGFEAALADRAAKQRMWAYLKQIRPAAAPY